MSLSTKLQAYYTGELFIDSSGFGHDVTPANVTVGPGGFFPPGTGSQGNGDRWLFDTNALNAGVVPGGGTMMDDVEWSISVWFKDLTNEASVQRFLFRTGILPGNIDAPVMTDVGGELGCVVQGVFQGITFPLHMNMFPSWAHIAVVFEPNGATLTYYINGAQVGNVINSAAQTYPSPTMIGGTPGVVGSGQCWSESLQDLVIWDRAITPVEVLDIYDKGIEGKKFNDIAGPDAPESVWSGSPLNDYLIWSWGWELDAALYSGYSNDIIEGGCQDPLPDPTFFRSPSSCQWYSEFGWAPHTYGPQIGAGDKPFRVPSGPFPDLFWGSPWYFDPGGSPSVWDNGYYPWSTAFCIVPNYDSSRDTLFQGAFPAYGVNVAPFGPTVFPWGPAEFQQTLQMLPGELEESFNADFTSEPSREYGAGKKCLLLAGHWRINPHDVPETTFLEVPTLYTPALGCYNLAISGSDLPVDHEARTRGPRAGWLQFSYKTVCNQYHFDGLVTGGNPANSLVKYDNAGGSDKSPIIVLWREYRTHADGKIVAALIPVNQDSEPQTGPATGTREVMLAIAPFLPTSGIGPVISGAPTLGPTFALPMDRDWHRIAIKFYFNQVPIFGGYTVSVYLDGLLVIAPITVTMTPAEALLFDFQEWERIAFSAGTSTSIFDQENYSVGARNHFTSFGMFDHILLWGSSDSNGVEKLYIEGLRPKADAGTSTAGGFGGGGDPTGNGFWDSMGSSSVAGTNFNVVADQNNPDIWSVDNPGADYYAKYESPAIFWSPPPFVFNLRNDIEYGLLTVPPGFSFITDANFDNSSYAFSLEKSTDIEPDWFPADIRGVTQISIHSYESDEQEFSLLSSVYSTMSIGPTPGPPAPGGPTFVTSWPQPKLDFPVASPDIALADHMNGQNIIWIMSSCSYTGNKWTPFELNVGTGSIFVGPQ